MADVELVIKIPEKWFDDMVKEEFTDVDELCAVIQHGTLLPKGHKRLIEDKFEVGPIFDEEGNRVGYKYVTQEDLNSAETIIEADTENEVEKDELEQER